MKVIASVQAKRSSSRGLVHYIAHSKVDGEKEPVGREIFNEYTNQLDVEKANNFLASGISKRSPDNDELHHLVISLKAEDYERLGESELERQTSFKEITRHLMKQFEKEIGADKLKWAAAIHRNTENPHVHLALQKKYFDQKLQKKNLTKIPATLLPHYEKSETGEKILSVGLLIKSATEKLEEILREKEQLRDQIPPKSQSEKNRPQSSLIEKDNPTKMVKAETNINPERNILAGAILAKYYLDKSKEIVSSLENHGDQRRFKIFDEITKKHRRMSLFDLTRRAEKNANQIIKKQDLSDPTAGEKLKKKLVTDELSKNEAGIKRIRIILHNLLRKENQEFRTRENEYKTIKPAAEKIRNSYRKANKKLPVPNLTWEELEMLQRGALARKDFRAAAYLERVRRELSSERGNPTRTDDEISRLKANQKISSLNIKLQEKELRDFQTRKRTIPVEAGDKKRTLNEIDSLLAGHRANERSLAGKVGFALHKMGLSESPAAPQSLGQAKALVTEKLNEKNDLMEKNLADQKSLLKMLDNFYQHDTNPDKAKMEAKFTAPELAEIESLAFSLKLADVYRDNWDQQKQFIESAAGGGQVNDETLKKTKEDLLAGRALAREIICEIEVARAKDELAKFKKYRDFQKFEIKDEQHGNSKFVSLAEVGLNHKGSIFDQTLEYFLENREVRKMRHAVEKRVEEKAAELKENIKAAVSLLKGAGEAAAEFKTRSLFGKSSSQHLPVFTPKELSAIEHRLVQTTNPDEAKNLQKILDSIDPSQAKNLSAILQTFDRNKETDRSLTQHSRGDQKSANQSGKVEEKTQDSVSQNRENKSETFTPDRGR